MNKNVELAAKRLLNFNRAGEGSNVPPRLAGNQRVPFVSGFHVIATSSFFGATLVTLGFEEPPFPIDIAQYNVYVKNAFSGNDRPTFIGSVPKSPGQVLCQTDSGSGQDVTFFIQTVLTSGQVSKIEDSPTCTANVSAPALAIGDIPDDLITVAKLADGTPGQLISWDASGEAVTFGAGAVDTILVGAGAATPTFKSRATLDLVQGRSTLTAIGQIVLGTATAGTVGVIAAGAADSILVGSGTGVNPQFKTRTQLDLVEGRSTLTTANRIVKVSSSGVVTQASFADTDVVTGAANLTNAGAIPFVVSAGVLTDDPSNFVWDDTNNILAIGTNSPWTGGTNKFHVRTGTDENFVFAGPQTLASGVTYHSFNDAVSANVGLEFRGFPIMLFPAGASPGVIVGRQPTSPLALLHVSHHTLGNAVFRIESVATNDDPACVVYQNRLTTTDATVTTIHTVAIPTTTTIGLIAHVVARRTGGAAGTAEDGAFYIRAATFKNVAGTATQIGATTALHTNEDQAGWDLTFAVAAGNALIQVTGAVDNNIVWHLSKLEYMPVGS